ncbi:hypothetical protein EYF80_030754 [Liparis tanakae]|uniref:Uncharacterized protein n=1 Tax=Liparis tanakae TaxID=230148 RepID=A0A4Z2GZS1_9TELE|nr:hypothetical protein EYF80_030754 [Liparis tanakae]
MAEVSYSGVREGTREGPGDSSSPLVMDVDAPRRPLATLVLLQTLLKVRARTGGVETEEGSELDVKQRGRDAVIDGGVMEECSQFQDHEMGGYEEGRSPPPPPPPPQPAASKRSRPLGQTPSRSVFLFLKGLRRAAGRLSRTKGAP